MGVLATTNLEKRERGLGVGSWEFIHHISLFVANI